MQNTILCVPIPSYVFEFEQIVVSCYVASLSADLHGVGIHIVLHQSTGNQAWKHLLQHTLCCSLNCNAVINQQVITKD